MIFSIFPGLGAGRVDGLGEASRVGRLDVVATALSGEIVDSITREHTFYVVVFKYDIILLTNSGAK